MKTISVKQSRRNTAGRRRKVAARHGKAGHWRAQSKPMFGTGRMHYEVGTHTDAMCYGGIAAIHRLVTKLGLAKTIDATLKLLKVHLPYHESDHVLNLAYNVLCGGDSAGGYRALAARHGLHERFGRRADSGPDHGG